MRYFFGFVGLQRMPWITLGLIRLFTVHRCSFWYRSSKPYAIGHTTYDEQQSSKNLILLQVMSPVSVTSSMWLALKVQADIPRKQAKQLKSEKRQWNERIKSKSQISSLPPSSPLSYERPTKNPISKKIFISYNRRNALSKGENTSKPPKWTCRTYATHKTNLWPRWLGQKTTCDGRKTYALSELRQRGCDWAITGKELATIDSIKAKLIDCGFQKRSAQAYYPEQHAGAGGREA